MIHYYTPHEAASMLRVSAQTIYREIRAGKLRGRRVGRGLRISESAINDYMGDPVCEDPVLVAAQAS